MKNKKIAAIFALLAAALYAINIPISKLFLSHITPTMMAAFLYLGAGIGLYLCSLFSGKDEIKSHLSKQDLPYIIGMVVLDIVAPILLMIGLTLSDSANASLLNNFEIVATSAIAFFVFKETVSKRLFLSITLITLASAILGFEGEGSLHFSIGSLFVLAAACCWGLENNCTRMLSGKSSTRITTIKGICSGTGSLIVALLVGEKLPELRWIGPVLILGFVAYGLSINFYILAQRELGSAKTSAYYSVAPFFGVLFSILFFGELPTVQFYIGLSLMVVATYLVIRDTVSESK